MPPPHITPWLQVATYPPTSSWGTTPLEYRQLQLVLTVVAANLDEG